VTVALKIDVPWGVSVGKREGGEMRIGSATAVVRPCRLLVGGLLLIAGGGPAAAAPPAAAKVLSVTGTLRINGKPGAPGTLLHERDRLATGANSVAFVGFADGSAIRLNAGSRLDLASLGRATSLSLQTGSVLSAVHKGARYSVTTPRAVAAVRGTVFYVEATPARPGYVCVCEGTVSVTDRRNRRRSQVITTQTHRAVSVQRSRIAPDKMLGHTDDEIAELKVHAR
jgi:hypothetical protein